MTTCVLAAGGFLSFASQRFPSHYFPSPQPLAKPRLFQNLSDLQGAGAPREIRKDRNVQNVCQRQTRIAAVVAPLSRQTLNMTRLFLQALCDRLDIRIFSHVGQLLCFLIFSWGNLANITPGLCHYNSSTARECCQLSKVGLLYACLKPACAGGGQQLVESHAAGPKQ